MSAPRTHEADGFSNAAVTRAWKVNPCLQHAVWAEGSDRT
jgi:hypothetical protein